MSEFLAKYTNHLMKNSTVELHSLKHYNTFETVCMEFV